MFSTETYLSRRHKLSELMNDGVVLIHGNDESPMDTFAAHYPFRQNSVFLYYTGIKTPSVVLLMDLDKGETILYADEYTLDDQIWTGPVQPIEEIAGLSGIKNVKQTSDLGEDIQKILDEKRSVHYPPSCRSEILIKLSSLLKIKAVKVNDNSSEKLIKSIVTQREIKSDKEIDEIEEAVAVSREVYMMLLNELTPGINEKTLAAKLDCILKSKGLINSFPTILTKYGAYLHGLKSEYQLDDGDLLLIDSGTLSDEGYSSDITRTFPVSGKFTEKQNAIYNIVLEANKTAIEMAKPGLLYMDVHRKACEIIVEGLSKLGIMKGNVEEAVTSGAYAIFMPHGLGHMLGMDTHDMEVLGEDYVGYNESVTRSSIFGLSALRFAKKLKPGHVLTVEPGIYFIPGLISKWKTENKFTEFINYKKLEEYIDFGGIRIEDDILITDEGCRVLGPAIPKTTEEIDRIMRG